MALIQAVAPVRYLKAHRTSSALSACEMGRLVDRPGANDKLE